VQGHVDVHAHYFPKSYLEWLESFTSTTYEGSVLARNMATECRRRAAMHPGVTDIGERLRDMDNAGIEVDLISVGNVDIALAGADGAVLARTLNDSLAAERDAHPDRFAALGAISLYDVDGACEELHRLRRDLGFVGVMLPTHVRGEYLESERLDPFFAIAQELDVVISLHPTVPGIATPPMEPYGLTPLLGFVADMGVTVLRMILSGMLDRRPSLKVVVPHLGGMLPYLLRRVEDGWTTNHDAGSPLERLPSEYLRSFWFDTVHADPANITCAVMQLGADRLLLGTDYPFFTGRAGAWATVHALEAAGIDEKARAAICHGSAVELFGL
jgi:aminocarboxymuconate-semialdehyde decarboxylase